MANITDGTIITSIDFPRTVWAQDATQLLNLSNTSYEVGTPEVGVYFMAPTTGRVILTVGGAARDNTNNNRVFLSPEVLYPDRITQVLAPSTNTYGWATPGTNSQCVAGSRVSLLSGLSPMQIYYARVVHLVEIATGSTADIFVREIIVEPAS